MRASSVLLLVAGLFALASGCTNDDGVSHPIGTPGTITGRVIDATTFRALEGVRIVTEPSSHTVLTDSTGRFTLQNMAVASFRVIATRTGYHSDTSTVQVVSGSSVTADIALVRDVEQTTFNALAFNGATMPEGEAAGIFVPETDTDNFGVNDLTVEAWIRPTGFGEERWNWILSKGQSYDFLFGVVDRKPFIQAANTKSFAHGKTQLLSGNWYHIAGVRTAFERKIRIYVNGVLDAEAQIDGNFNAVPGDIVIGKYTPVPGDREAGFQGVIHELRVWSAALTGEQIRERMNRRANGTEPNLKYCWPLNDGTGRTVNELARGRDGIFVNAPEWVDVDSPLD